MTVFLTTQYLEEADVLADRVGIIDHGRIVAEGTPTALKAEIGRPTVEVVPADPEQRDRLADILGRFGELVQLSPDERRRPLRARRVSTSPRSSARSTPRSVHVGEPPAARPVARRRLPREDRPHARGRGGGGRGGDGSRAGARRERHRARRSTTWPAARSCARARQPANVVAPVIFPLGLLAVNSGGLQPATLIPGFPTDRFVAFALAIPFMQGALFATMNAGHRPRPRHPDRLPQPPLADARCAGVALVARPARRRRVSSRSIQAIVYVVVGYAVDVRPGVRPGRRGRAARRWRSRSRSASARSASSWRCAPGPASRSRASSRSCSSSCSSRR